MAKLRITWASVVLGSAAVAITVGLLTVRRQPPDERPLSGETWHDFGEVTFRNRKIELKHIFALTNETHQTIEITDTKSSCGCTVGEVSRNVLRPGQTVDITVTLTLLSGGPRSEKVWLNLGEHGIQPLTVSARARITTAFYAAQKAVMVRRDGKAEITLVATSDGGDETPPFPGIDSPPAVGATFAGWQLVHLGDPALGRSARWHGTVLVEQLAEDVPDRAKLVVRLWDKQTVEIDLTGWPWG